MKPSANQPSSLKPQASGLFDRLRRVFRRGDRKAGMSRAEIELAYRELNEAALWQLKRLEVLPLPPELREKLARGVTPMSAMAVALGAVLDADASYTASLRRMLLIAKNVNAAAKFGTN